MASAYLSVGVRVASRPWPQSGSRAGRQLLRDRYAREPDRSDRRAPRVQHLSRTPGGHAAFSDGPVILTSLFRATARPCWFATGFVVTVLTLTEIVPKTIGVVHANTLARACRPQDPWDPPRFLAPRPVPDTRRDLAARRDAKEGPLQVTSLEGDPHAGRPSVTARGCVRLDHGETDPRLRTRLRENEGARHHGQPETAVHLPLGQQTRPKRNLNPRPPAAAIRGRFPSTTSERRARQVNGRHPTRKELFVLQLREDSSKPELGRACRCPPLIVPRDRETLTTSCGRFQRER
jgi:hypothetical protein